MSRFSQFSLIVVGGRMQLSSCLVQGTKLSMRERASFSIIAFGRLFPSNLHSFKFGEIPLLEVLHSHNLLRAMGSEGGPHLVH